MRLFQRGTVMINRKIFVLATVGLLGSFLPLFDPPNRALAGCGFLDITCNPRNWDSPSKTIRDNITPPLPQRRSEIYDSFTINNQSNETVFFAYAAYVPGSNSSSGGDGASLPVVTPPSWVSQGWWAINSHESKVVYETKNKGESIYIRIASSKGIKVPTGSNQTANFCHSNQPYRSQTIERPLQISLMINGISNRGSSCEQIGGHSETFWQIKANTNFTINQ